MSQPSAAPAMRTAGWAGLTAGTTVVIGMLGLLVLRQALLNGVAIAAAATVAMTVLASLTPLLGFTGQRQPHLDMATRTRGYSHSHYLG